MSSGDRMTGVLPTSASLEHHRQQFSVLGNKAYFNYGGQGPMPQGALAAIQQAQISMQEAGPFSGEVNRWIGQESDQTRAAIAHALGVTPATIALTEDVTVGCNIALWGMDWRSGDHLLLSDCEHPGIIAVIQELQHRFGIEVSTCPLRNTLNGGDPIVALTDHLRPNTRLVVLSHILWNTGQVLPLTELVAACRSQVPQVQILVDAAQSVGVLPLQLAETGVDFYAFTGHKWWCGAAGLGGLYVRSEALETLRPTFLGWRSIVGNPSGYPIGWKPDARRYEIATSDFALCSGLRAAIAVHDQWGTPELRYQQIQRLSGILWQKLVELPGVVCLRESPPEAGLISFQIPGRSHGQLVQFLESRGCFVRTLLDPDCIRACVHYFTLESELDRLVGTLQEGLTTG